MVFATNGIVTKVGIYKENDKIINIITPEKGRLCVIVKGGRKMQSSNSTLSQMFTYGNFELYEKHNIYWLRGGEVLNPFYDLSADIERVALAGYLCEVANDLTDENYDGEDILKLLLNSLYLIGRGNKPLTLIKAVFEMRIVSISGYQPDLSGCVGCGERVRDDIYLNILDGKMVCSACLNKKQTPIKFSREFDYTEQPNILKYTPASVIAALIFVTESPHNKIFSFEIKDPEELKLFGVVCETYLLNHLERGFPTLDFYKGI